ncbi:MAG: MarR family transcriptional regulator [Proteobacteria bacterium]|nr:MarR family transcriptional regulator [Pseudomonadota bacterium]
MFGGATRKTQEHPPGTTLAKPSPVRDKPSAFVSSSASPTPGSVIPLDSPHRRRLPPLLRRAWYSLNQTFRRRIAHTGVTPDQFTALRTLLEGDPQGMTQRSLTEAMSSDPNTVASLLERMEEAGWVERQAHERDRRAYRIRLQPLGHDKYREVRDVAVGLQSDVLAGLPESERERFLEQLEIVAMACRRAAETSSKAVSR